MDEKGVLLCSEITEGKLAPITLELLGIGRNLADELDEELSILLIGKDMGSLGKEAITFGADKVYLADDQLLEEFNSDAYTYVIANLCQKLHPSILLLGQTDMGRDVAPRLAGRLKAGLAMDCIRLTVDSRTGLLNRVRPIFGGNANATVITTITRPQMATIRPGVMTKAKFDNSHKGEVIIVKEAIEPSAIKIKTLERIKEEIEGLRLEDAEIVVSGGRGIGSAEGFQAIRQLAHLLGGAVGATRAACDEQWVPSTFQVGQTGKIVSPKFYIAIGISGAMQHIAGCSGAKYIIAINKDPDANIFKVGHFGIVGDWNEALPALTQKLKELIGAQN